VLTAEVPGVARHEIEIQAEENRIVIRGERTTGPAGRPGQGPGSDILFEQYHRVERGHGRFSRAFTLPEMIDVEGVKADLRDGLLTVTIPKGRDRGTRRINVT